MPNSEIKILRDELAKVIADANKRDSIIEQLTRALKERDRIITEIVMENDFLKRCLKIYENTHSLPLCGSVSVQQQKARSTERSKSSERDEGKTDRMPGCKPRPRRNIPPQKIQGSDTPQAGQMWQVWGTSISDARTTSKQIIEVYKQYKWYPVC